VPQSGFHFRRAAQGLFLFPQAKGECMEISIEAQAKPEDSKPKEPKPETNSRLELKYCEGCGALTLRPSSSSEIYCSRCAKKFAEIARQKETDRLNAANRRKS
jgi:ribosomal protein L37AE/L43A